MTTDRPTDGARVLRELGSTHGASLIPGAALPEGTFTEREFAAIIARVHHGVTYEDGIIVVPAPRPGVIH